MIAITAAGGNVGRPLTRLLLDAGVAARLLVRDAARDDAGRGLLEAVTADLDDPEHMTSALTGVSRLFLLSPGPDTPRQDAIAITAARAAGVEQVVLLSSLGVEVGGVGGGRAHEPGEQALATSGLPATVLRPSEFMTNTLRWLPEITANSTVSVPSGGGAVGFVDPADIAAVAFAALTTGDHDGRTYRLTGPATLTVADAAAQIGAALGKAVEHRDVTDAEFRDGAERAHLPAAMIETLSEYYAAVKQDRMAILSSDVETVTGQPATPFADWAATALGAGSAA
ncbi:MAG TPA: NAD(P)H-binding protein [Pseudonocardia sp.]